MATIDFAYQQDADGMFDLVIDRDAGDFAVTPGLETSMLVSLFSDRRADQSEVSDPMQRRGWIGNLVAETVGDNHGSGLWLYEQRRLTDDIALGVKTEAVQSFDWMVDDGLATYVEADVRQVPSKRALYLDMTIHFPNGQSASRAYALADATRNGTITTIPRFDPATDDALAGAIMWNGQKMIWDYGNILGWGG